MNVELELSRAREKLHLTDSDLAILLGKPRATVSTWRKGARSIRDPFVRAEVERRLVKIFASRFLPPPYEMSSYDRPDYLRSLAAQFSQHGRVPERDPAGDRKAVRHNDRRAAGA